MDEQNWIEKIGLIKEIGDVKGNQIRMAEQLSNLISVNKEHYDQMVKLLNEHHAELYGPPEPGLKIHVDRLIQWKSAIVVAWVVLTPTAAKVLYDMVKH